MNAVQPRATPGAARWNVGLTLLALLVLGVSFVFRLQGGKQHPFVDSTQLLVIWGYLLLTPVLCAFAWRARKTSGVSSVTNLLVFGLWLVVVIGGMFVHL